MPLLAQIIEADGDIADVLFILAALLFMITAVMHVTARATETALPWFGATALALGLAWLG